MRPTPGGCAPGGRRRCSPARRSAPCASWAAWSPRWRSFPGSGVGHRPGVRRPATTAARRDPAESPATRRCDLLLGPNGTKVFGETWAVRTSDNHLVVWTFPDVALGGSRRRAAVRAQHRRVPGRSTSARRSTPTTCAAAAPPRSTSRSARTASTPSEPAFWALTVLQGSSSAVSTGGADCLQSPTRPRPRRPRTRTRRRATPTTTHTHSHSPSATPTTTHTHSPRRRRVTPTTTHTHSPSTLAERRRRRPPRPPATSRRARSCRPRPRRSPSTSVLAHQAGAHGPTASAGALVLSVALLGLGGDPRGGRADRPRGLAPPPLAPSRSVRSGPARAMPRLGLTRPADRRQRPSWPGRACAEPHDSRRTLLTAARPPTRFPAPDSGRLTL